MEFNVNLDEAAAAQFLTCPDEDVLHSKRVDPDDEADALRAWLPACSKPSLDEHFKL